jgi:hypothetical protein
VWAGLVPISTQAGQPVDDGRVRPEASAPEMSRFARKRRTME